MPLLPTYNERTDFDIEVTLLDKDGDPLVPTTAFYSIHDVASNNLVKDWTEFTVNAQGVGTIAVLAADLAIVEDANADEERILTVQGTYGASKEFAEEYRFKVKNLTVIPKEA
jgi:hypothetical protein